MKRWFALLIPFAALSCAARPDTPITDRMQAAIDANRITGAVTLVANRDRILSLQATGHADVAGQRPLAEDALFAIASMTKPITATAILRLQDEGKLSVEDPISKYIPAFKTTRLADGVPADPITLRHLLTHTSGVRHPPRKGGEPKSLEQAANRIAALPLQFPPGSRWKYGQGLTICGRVIEVVSGQSYEEFLHERIFEPLKMKDTTFRPTPAQWERVAEMIRPGKDGTGIAPAASPLTDRTTIATRVPNPSGGLFSTAADLGRFYRMVLRGGELNGVRVVSEPAVEQMASLHTGNLTTGFTPGNGWGLGWCVVREPQGVTAMLCPGTFGHGGAFGTQGWVDPRQGLIFVLMIQRTGFGNSDGSQLRGDFQRHAVEAFGESRTMRAGD